MKDCNGITDYAIKRSRIDTHSHIEPPFPSLLEQAKLYEHLTTTSELMESRVKSIGCRELYGIDTGTYLLPDAPKELFEKSEAFYKMGHAEAFEEALRIARIENQLCFTAQLYFHEHYPENCPLPSFSPKIKLLAFIDGFVAGNDQAFCPDGRREDFCYYESLCGHFGILKNLDDYLNALDENIDMWRGYHVVGIKVALAYTTGLSFGDPSYPEAKKAFSRKEDMSTDEVKQVQDFAFRHILLAAKRNGFPVVIHTGFQIWGHADLRQSNPILLHNILTDERYKDIAFILLHGGQPYIGETTYLAGMFPEVFIDFTWLPWLSRTRFRMALGEWLEMVPHNRFCWGSDSTTPEDIVGIDMVVREEIASVLQDHVQRRMLDRKAALRFIDNAYYDTPKKLFSL